MGNQVKICPWEFIDDFHGINEFERFEQWLKEQSAIGEAVEVSVTRPYLDASTFHEKWYCHVASGEVWRLVWPDGPFTGLFERVT